MKEERLVFKGTKHTLIQKSEKGAFTEVQDILGQIKNPWNPIPTSNFYSLKRVKFIYSHIGFRCGCSKAKQNIKKHKVSFEEETMVFFDKRATEFFDPDRSKNEERI
jgi:hypothetical protein